MVLLDGIDNLDLSEQTRIVVKDLREVVNLNYLGIDLRKVDLKIVSISFRIVLTIDLNLITMGIMV